MANNTAPSSDDLIVRRQDLEFTYQDSDGGSYLYPRVGQGPARPATEEELAKDTLGFTNPNLHRRIDPHDPPIVEDPKAQELKPRDYELTIQHLHSYRTTTINSHDEESTYSEVP